MANLVLFQSLTLDGVMQAPGRPDEDTRGGFPFGGWATPYAVPELGKAAGESMATTGGLLLGRRTYQDFYRVWPNQTDNPFTEVLNQTPKYVASSTLQEPLPWMNSILLIHPLILGTGSSLVRDGASFSQLDLVDIRPTTTGVLVASYRPQKADSRSA